MFIFIYLYKYGIYCIYIIFIIFSMSYSKGANQKNDPLCFEEKRDSISGFVSLSLLQKMFFIPLSFRSNGLPYHYS